MVVLTGGLTWFSRTSLYLLMSAHYIHHLLPQLQCQLAFHAAATTAAIVVHHIHYVAVQHPPQAHYHAAQPAPFLPAKAHGIVDDGVGMVVVCPSLNRKEA